MMNSFNLMFYGKHFICPSILNDSFAGYSNCLLYTSDAADELITV